MREITQRVLLPRWLTAFLSRSSMEMPACHFLSVDADLNQHPVTKVRWVSPPPQPHLRRRKSYGTLKQQFILRFFASFHPPTPQLMLKRVMLWWPTHFVIYTCCHNYSAVLLPPLICEKMGHEHFPISPVRSVMRKKRWCSSNVRYSAKWGRHFSASCQS